MINTIRQVVFPNPFGFPLPARERVLALQETHGFSNDYADFLVTQNGMRFFEDGEPRIDRRRYLSGPERDSQGCADLSVLHGLDGSKPWPDLYHVEAFGTAFFPIGTGCNGDDYVEVLAGKRKGWIVSLDHELYFGGTQEDIIDWFDLTGFREMSRDEQADVLTCYQTGLAWLHARSMKEFAASCVYWAPKGPGYVKDAILWEEKKQA